MVTPRKHYNLARAKLAVYANRMKDVRRAQRARDHADRESEQYERLSKRYKNAVATAQSYFSKFRLHYDAIPTPSDPATAALSERLLELESTRRTVYVMRTGLGKGYSFDDRHIAAAVGVRTETVERLFQAALEALHEAFEPYIPAASSELISEITQLSPELLAHLRRNEHHLDLVSWQVYEQLVAEFFASWGYEVSLVGRNARTSADVIALRPPDASGIAVRLFIEVKKTAYRIGIDTINAVLGSIYSESLQERFHAGVIVSSAGYQDFKKLSVPGLRHLGVELRDGNDVRRWLREYEPSRTGLWLRPE